VGVVTSFNLSKIRSSGEVLSALLLFCERREGSCLPYEPLLQDDSALRPFLRLFIHSFVLSLHSLSYHKSINSFKVSSPQRAT